MTDVQPRTDSGLQHEEPTRGCSAPTRRAVLVGAGAVGATAVLAACGTDTPASTGNAGTGSGANDAPLPAGSPNPGTGSSGGSGGKTLIAAADVPTGGGVIKGDYVITQPTEGTFKAFSKVCTHQGCPVTKVTDGLINCKCHNSNFSIEDGSVQSGPAKKPLEETKVTLDGDDIVTA
ncbi:MAG TPA: Rieske (2Fe-2S) protein [Actinoplanes sp.]